MSRTKKTAPVEVKCFTAPGMIEPVHDHTSGECDLPPRPTRRVDATGARTLWSAATSCYWVPSQAFNRSPLGVCGCSTCGYSWFYRAERRKQRYTGRRLVRDAVKDVAMHLEDRIDLDALADDVSYGSRIDEEYRFCALLRDALGLPDDTYVVDYDYATLPLDAQLDGDVLRAEAADDVDAFTFGPYGFKVAAVEVMHNDGAREHLLLDTNGVAA